MSPEDDIPRGRGSPVDAVTAPWRRAAALTRVRAMTDVAVGAPAEQPPGPPAGPPAIPQFQVIPVAALPFVALALVALVAGILSDELWPLMFLHVVFGAIWTVIDLFVAFVIGPIMGRMAVPARIEFITRFMPKMAVIMPTVVAITLAAGWQLGTHLGTVHSDYVNHDWVVASYIVVGVMAVVALGLLEPANIGVLVELKKRRPSPAVIERLMKRFIYTSGIIGVMQIATLVIMVKLRTG